MAIPDTEDWHIFLDQYKDLPELWQIKSDTYKNREKKKKAWAQLLRFYNCIVPDATANQMKTRINNLRTCYRRELKKVTESEASGAGVDDVYVPSLWYYEHLNFLRDHEEATQGISTLDSCEEEDGEPVTPAKKKQKSAKDIRGEFFERAIEQLDARKKNTDEKGRDDATVYADAWAVGYRKMTTDQQLYAKQAIDQIILLGQLGKLTLNMVNTPIGNIPASGQQAGYGVYLNAPEGRGYHPTHVNQQAMHSSVPSTSRCGPRYVKSQDDTQYADPGGNSSRSFVGNQTGYFIASCEPSTSRVVGNRQSEQSTSKVYIESQYTDADICVHTNFDELFNDPQFAP